MKQIKSKDLLLYLFFGLSLLLIYLGAGWIGVIGIVISIALSLWVSYLFDLL